jgi:hypothetical protein
VAGFGEQPGLSVREHLDKSESMAVVPIQVATGSEQLAHHPIVSGSALLDVPNESLSLVLRILRFFLVLL